MVWFFIILGIILGIMSVLLVGKAIHDEDIKEITLGLTGFLIAVLDFVFALSFQADQRKFIFNIEHLAEVLLIVLMVGLNIFLFILLIRKHNHF